MTGNVATINRDNLQKIAGRGFLARKLKQPAKTVWKYLTKPTGKIITKHNLKNKMVPTIAGGIYAGTQLTDEEGKPRLPENLGEAAAIGAGAAATGLTFMPAYWKTLGEKAPLDQSIGWGVGALTSATVPWTPFAMRQWSKWEPARRFRQLGETLDLSHSSAEGVSSTAESVARSAKALESMPAQIWSMTKAVDRLQQHGVKIELPPELQKKIDRAAEGVNVQLDPDAAEQLQDALKDVSVSVNAENLPADLQQQLKSLAGVSEQVESTFGRINKGMDILEQRIQQGADHLQKNWLTYAILGSVLAGGWTAFKVWRNHLKRQEQKRREEAGYYRPAY